MNIILQDFSWQNFLPLTFTRPVAELRLGILTLRQKWERMLGAPANCLSEAYLLPKFPCTPGRALYINSSLLPTPALCKQIEGLARGQALVSGSQLLAYLADAPAASAEGFHAVAPCHEPTLLTEIWQLNELNAKAIADDFALITAGRESQPLPDHCKKIGTGDIFIEPGAQLWGAMLNASAGPIYIGADAEVMEGAVIRGPFALCEHAQVKMLAKVYGPVTVGPYSRIGGEVGSSILIGYSNKGHDGYMGNSVLGEWCNWGADTNNSNLKNNYAPVKLWSYAKERFVGTGLQFCGLIMGDHSKCGINTMFNTGTVVGICCNLFSDGFPRQFVPDFAWGGSAGFTVHALPKVFETMEVVMKRRGLELSAADRGIIEHVFEQTARFRNFAK